ncbi:hypothetical protein DSM104329_00921 [Capillimicrobium parvum]|uniref:Uncharacterized protein n=1 Tax=Capillimicrobium parvum TaxID=2884022 RepID=A0A9E7BZP2_9ACTN|nr:hypothetical protein DSM104329_00921 [Capillimicrobium parvum]
MATCGSATEAQRLRNRSVRRELPDALAVESPPACVGNTRSSGSANGVAARHGNSTSRSSGCRSTSRTPASVLDCRTQMRPCARSICRHRRVDRLADAETGPRQRRQKRTAGGEVAIVRSVEPAGGLDERQDLVGLQPRQLLRHSLQLPVARVDPNRVRGDHAPLMRDIEDLAQPRDRRVDRGRRQRPKHLPTLVADRLASFHRLLPPARLPKLGVAIAVHLSHADLVEPHPVEVRQQHVRELPPIRLDGRGPQLGFAFGEPVGRELVERRDVARRLRLGWRLPLATSHLLEDVGELVLSPLPRPAIGRVAKLHVLPNAKRPKRIAYDVPRRVCFSPRRPWTF